MNTKTFLHKVNLKKQNKEFKDWIDKDGWPNRTILRLDHSHFRPLHRVGHGRNGASRLIDFTTQVSEVDAIHFERSRFGSLRVYMYSRISIGQTGFTRDKGYFVKLRKGDKEHLLELHQRWNDNDVWVDELVHVMDEPYGNDKLKKKLQSLVNTGMDHVTQETGKTDFQEFMESKGMEVLQVFKFNCKVVLSDIDYVHKTTKSLEIGYTDKTTYNALPGSLKFTMVRIIKTVSLEDIGVEASGCYSHDDREQILPEKLPEVKKFMRMRQRRIKK